MYSYFIFLDSRFFSWGIWRISRAIRICCCKMHHNLWNAMDIFVFVSELGNLCIVIRRRSGIKFTLPEWMRGWMKFWWSLDVSLRWMMWKKLGIDLIPDEVGKIDKKSRMPCLGHFCFHLATMQFILNQFFVIRNKMYSLKLSVRLVGLLLQFGY